LHGHEKVLRKTNVESRMQVGLDDTALSVQNTQGKVYGVYYTEVFLRGIGNSLYWMGITDPSLAGYNDEDPDDHFVWVSTGTGEIHLSNEGCWWLHWDQTHGVDDEKELTVPVTEDPAVIARWLLDQIPQFEKQ